jgi:hypothetical protein
MIAEYTTEKGVSFIVIFSNIDSLRRFEKDTKLRGVIL